MKMNTPMDKKDISIKLETIELLSKTMIERPQVGMIGDKFNFNINVETKVNTTIKTVLYLVTIEITEIDKTQVIGSVKLGVSYSIVDFDKHITKRKNENIYDVPLELDALLKSMSVSTTRGVMFSEFTGTYLFKAVLPIVIFSPIVGDQTQRNEPDLINAPA